MACLIALIKSDCEIAEEDLVQLKKLREYDDCVSRTTTEELEETNSYACCHLYYEVDSNNFWLICDSDFKSDSLLLSFFKKKLELVSLLSKGLFGEYWLP